MKTLKARKIYSSTKYGTFKNFKKEVWGIFKKLKGNREVVFDDKYRKLLKNTSEKGEMLGTGKVNEKMEVIDGQNRLAICMQLRIPFYFEMEKGATIKDAQKMNSNTKAWTFLDYAKSYANEGNKHYREYLRLRKKFPKIRHSVLKLFIAKGDAQNTQKWNEGLFELSITNDYNNEDICKKFEEIRSFFGAGRDQDFGKAFKIAYKNPAYDHSRMVNGAQRYINKHTQITGGLMRISGDLGSNCDLMTAMFNFGKRPKNRVTLARTY